MIGLNGKSNYAHRLAWFYTYGTWPTEVDHINGQRTDNRISNLREVVDGSNNQNHKKHSSNTSGFGGVSWSKAKRKWGAQVYIDGHNRFAGYYDTPEQAREDYIKKKIEAHPMYEGRDN